MEVLAVDETHSEAGLKIADYVTLEGLFSRGDVAALHCPLLSSIKEIIRKENIAKMKDGVIITNNSRGGLINERDPADALNGGKVYAAGLDAVSNEPIREDNPLLGAKNCIITPHISWAPKESRRRLMDITVKNLNSYIAGKTDNIVNN